MYPHPISLGRWVESRKACSHNFKVVITSMVIKLMSQLVDLDEFVSLVALHESTHFLSRLVKTRSGLVKLV